METQAQQEAFYRLALTLVPGIGTKTGRALLERYGSAEAIFRAPLKELKQDGIGEVKARGFKDEELLKKAADEMAFVVKKDLRIVFPGNGYPSRLSHCSDAPLLLFCQGTADLEAPKVVAIVGTRKNTDYGHQLTEELVEQLQQFPDMLVVSGMALGIDGIAHRKCVQLAMPTVGVLGHGLDRMYPHSHRELAQQMCEQGGGLLTEFPSGSLPEKGNFPMRNRVVAGMSDVTVVVESSMSGGALITAHMASGYNREVAAFPGRVSDSRSAGCNEIIRTNIASLITDAEDLVTLMGWDKEKRPKAVQKQLFINFSAEEQKVVDLLQTKDSVHADELFHHTGLASSQLAATLLQLEMQGIIRALPGKFYRMH